MREEGLLFFYTSIKMQAEPILIGSGAMQELQNRVERVETRVVEVVREVVKEEGGASESQLAELKEYVDEKVAGAGGEEKSGSAVSGIEPDGYWQPLAVNRYRFSKTFWKEVMGEEVEEVPEQKCIIWASYLGISLTFPDLVLPSGRTADWDGIEELWGALYKDGNYDEPLVPFRGPLPGTLIQSPNEVAVKGKTDTETGCYLTEKYVEDPNEINYEALWLHVSSTATKLGRLCFPLIELYPDSTLKHEVLSLREGIQTLGIGSTWTEDWVQVGQGETSLKDENRNPITAKLYTNSRKQLSMVLDGLFYSESGGWDMLCTSSLFTDVPVRYHP